MGIRRSYVVLAALMAAASLLVGSAKASAQSASGTSLAAGTQSAAPASGIDSTCGFTGTFTITNNLSDGSGDFNSLVTCQESMPVLYTYGQTTSPSGVVWPNTSTSSCQFCTELPNSGALFCAGDCVGVWTTYWDVNMYFPSTDTLGPDLTELNFETQHTTGPAVTSVSCSISGNDLTCEVTMRTVVD